MNTFTTQQRDEEIDAYPDEPTEQLPRRRRRQFLTRRSAALGALITCAIGFYAGIRVEKGQLSNSSTALGTGAGGGGGRAALAARFGRGTGAASGGATGAGAAGARAGGAGAGAGGFAGGFAG